MKPTKPVYCGPRVGLTLKKYDEHKDHFWMRDYRYVIFPEKHRKQQCLVILGMLKSGLNVEQVAKLINSKTSNTVFALNSEYQKGLKNKKESKL